ncbi:MAG: pilus assembly protein PilM [Planctomycetota bacterium]
MSERSLGIDIGSDSVKAVLARERRGRVQVLRAAFAPLEELGHMEDSPRRAAKIAMIVRNLLRSAGISSRRARIAVGGRRTIIRYTHVPPAPDWRLKMLIDYEVQGDTRGAGDLSYDFVTLDLPVATVERTVMMAMAKNDHVEHHCEILDEAGVPVENVTLSPFPVFNTYRHSRGPSIEDDKTTLLIHVGAENMDVVVERNGNLLFARNISPAGRAFTEAVRDEFRIPFAEAEELKRTKGRLLLGGEVGSEDETQASPSADAPTQVSPAADEDAETPIGFQAFGTDEDELDQELSLEEGDQTVQLSEAMLPVVGRLASAIQSSLMYCRAQTRMTDLEVDNMVLTGGGSRLPGLRQALSRRLGIPAVPADPLKGLDLSPLRREAREDLEARPESYVTALGLALGGVETDAVEFNLLPARIKERRRFFTKTLYLWLAGAAMIALVVLLGYSSVANTGRLRGYVRELEARHRRNEGAKAAMEKYLAVHTEYRAENRKMADIFRRPDQLSVAFRALTLANTVPDEVVLTRTQVVPGSASRPDAVVVQGQVRRHLPLPGGGTRELTAQEAEGKIGELRDRLLELKDPAGLAVFAAPSAGAVIRKMTTRELQTDKEIVATFELRFVLGEAQPAAEEAENE